MEPIQDPCLGREVVGGERGQGGALLMGGWDLMLAITILNHRVIPPHLSKGTVAAVGPCHILLHHLLATGGEWTVEGGISGRGTSGGKVMDP